MTAREAPRGAFRRTQAATVRVRTIDVGSFVVPQQAMARLERDYQAALARLTRIRSRKKT